VAAVALLIIGLASNCPNCVLWACSITSQSKAPIWCTRPRMLRDLLRNLLCRFSLGLCTVATDRSNWNTSSFMLIPMLVLAASKSHDAGSPLLSTFGTGVSTDDGDDDDDGDGDGDDDDDDDDSTATETVFTLLVTPASVSAPKPLKNGLCKACLAVGLLLGSAVNSTMIRFFASVLTASNTGSEKSTFALRTFLKIS